jgi:hypothetical protein
LYYLDFWKNLQILIRILLEKPVELSEIENLGGILENF